ncbi:glycerophosphocholine cholinephosphodiesterase ENPP6-like [Pollicipes pollicipes]|uniref:glycerophosphocholine cholinephosphodiesterase ENPP6-like n=1 Tax=Pollicipes pollicipes TaxID=41117 RepID=UPI001885898A|nr:glycerophosphocholine cholinephosphodiesterase ENPP6-like [Pollicipes pollicipes]
METEAFRPLPFFTHFVRYGARAEWLNPTFPSEGIATRASFFTGRYPEKHGILGEHFLDRQRGELRVDGPAGHSATDPAMWRRTAVFNVQGACVPIDGSNISFCQAPGQAGEFEESLTLALDRLFAEAYPCNMAIVHTDELRRTAEKHGATSEAVLDALRALDGQLQTLDRALLDRQARGEVNVVIVSDGGLTDTADMEVISVDSLLPSEAPVTVAGDGAACLVYMAGEHATAAHAQAQAVPGVRAYLRGAIPARMRLAHGQREPDLLLVAEPGYYLEHERPLAVEAAGGYDDTAGGVPDMRGVLLGRGPSFRAGVTVQQVNAVDVYAMLVALIQVTPEVHNGTWTTRQRPDVDERCGGGGGGDDPGQTGGGELRPLTSAAPGSPSSEQLPAPFGPTASEPTPARAGHASSPPDSEDLRLIVDRLKMKLEQQMKAKLGLEEEVIGLRRRAAEKASVLSDSDDDGGQQEEETAPRPPPSTVCRRMPLSVLHRNSHRHTTLQKIPELDELSSDWETDSSDEQSAGELRALIARLEAERCAAEAPL